MSDATIPALLARRAHESPGEPAFVVRDAEGDWRPVTWEALALDADRLAHALRQSGIGHGARLAILARTSLDWERVQIAALRLGAVVVGIDPNYPDATLAQALVSTAPQALFVDEPRQLDRVPASIQTAIGLIVAFRPERDGTPRSVRQLQDLLETTAGIVPESITAPSPDDPAIVVFSSGTTGTPKPIVYSHRQVLLAVDAILAGFPEIGRGSRLVCWLPLANLFQRIINFCAIVRGATSYLVEDPREIMQPLATASPHVFVGVPRFFEKLHAGIEERLARSPSIARNLARWGLAIGIHRAARLRAGFDADIGTRFRWAIADALVLRRLRGVFGRNIRFLISGSAPMPVWLLEWFEGLGLPVLEAYGVSEDIVPVAMNRPSARRLGTVGRPMQSNEVVLAPDGEVQVRGPGVFRGYLGAAAPALTPEGFWATGDLGEFTAEGFLRLAGRKSEAFKNASGRWIVPGEIEARLRRVPYVEHALVLGEGRSVPLAILNVDLARLRGKSGVAETGRQEAPLALEEGEAERIAGEVRAIVAELPPYLRPAGILIVTAPFSIAAGDLTSNLKLRRQFVSLKFRDRLAELQERATRAWSAAGIADAPSLPVVATA